MALIDTSIHLHKNPHCTLRELPIWLIHDLLQPLHAFGLELEHLKDELNEVLPKEHEIFASLMAMERAMQTEEHMLSSLRSYWRYTGTLTSPELRAVSIEKVIGAAQEQVRQRFQEVAFEFSGADRVLVTSDYAELQFLLILLIDNAARHSGSSVRICVEVHHNEERGVWLDIDDYGNGLSEQIELLLGAPFIRATSGRSRHAGLGLGIFLAALISSRLGHELLVTSIPERGCRFRLKLSQDSGADSSTRTSNSLGELKVLFAEGDERFAPSVSTLISSWGCRVNSFGRLNPVSLATLVEASADVVLMSHSVWSALQTELEQYWKQSATSAVGLRLRVVVLLPRQGPRTLQDISPVAQRFVKFVFAPISPSRLRSALLASRVSGD